MVGRGREDEMLGVVGRGKGYPGRHSPAME